MADKQLNYKSKRSPFLKWAGGKRWFVNRFHNLIPNDYNTYYEPFLGSGTVFFFLQPHKAILGDLNKDLIETYNTILTDWREVWGKLKLHHRCHNKEYYYYIRNSRPRTPVSKAARFIYLNRTCFNGLYRVNKKGEFNVPKGTKDSVIMSDDNFENVSILLQKAKILHADFEFVISKAKNNDFIYVDPPYTVKHNNNNFLKYNETIFSWEDQKRLAKSLFKASERGAKIIISNADHNCIHKLYDGFGDIHTVHRCSVLAANSDNRKNTTEIVITNM